MPDVFLSGSFDNLRSPDVRFLQEASHFGAVTVLLWTDESLARSGRPLPAFPERERIYMLAALRYVSRVIPVAAPADADRLPQVEGVQPGVWPVPQAEDTPRKREFCSAHGIAYGCIASQDVAGFPLPDVCPPAAGRKKVIVTGCYDWLHSGHIRFFEQASELGDLYVSVGNDANIRRLKGAGHPLLPQDERVYMVQAVRHVRRAFVAAGFGWLDAEAEMEALRPDIYLVNEDGDRREKRAFCAAHGMQYVVLKRLPKEGLPSRQSTGLRGF